MGKRNPHTNPGGRKRGVYVEERWRRLPSSHLQKCPNVFPRCLESVTRWAAGTSVALKQHSCVWVSSYLAFLPCPPLALPQAYSPSVMVPPLQVVSPILSAWLPQVLVPRVLGGYGFKGSEHLHAQWAEAGRCGIYYHYSLQFWTIVWSLDKWPVFVGFSCLICKWMHKVLPAFLLGACYVVMPEK